MARIPMRSGFSVIPEGEYVFRIYDATYDEDFGKIIIKMTTAKGMTHQERFSIKNADDEFNEKALNFFSFFAKTALNDFDMEDVDPEELIGHYIKATVIHNKVPSKTDPTRTMTFVNLTDIKSADEFDEEPSARALGLSKDGVKSVEQKKETPAADTDSLLSLLDD